MNEPIPFSSGDVLGFTPGPDQSDFFFDIYATSTVGNAHTYHTYNSFATELNTTDGNRVSASPIVSVKGMQAGTHGTVVQYNISNSYCFFLQ